MKLSPWLLVAGMLVFFLGVYDELFAAMVKEGCRTGLADACARASLITARAHAITCTGFGVSCVAIWRIARLLRDAP